MKGAEFLRQKTKLFAIQYENLDVNFFKKNKGYCFKN